MTKKNFKVMFCSLTDPDANTYGIVNDLGLGRRALTSLVVPLKAPPYTLVPLKDIPIQVPVPALTQAKKRAAPKNGGRGLGLF